MPTLNEGSLESLIESHLIGDKAIFRVNRPTTTVACVWTCRSS